MTSQAEGFVEGFVWIFFFVWVFCAFPPLTPLLKMHLKLCFLTLGKSKRRRQQYHQSHADPLILNSLDYQFQNNNNKSFE